VYMGDDDTEEAGFAAAPALGGDGILVGPARPSAAAFRLAGVEETLRWLEAAREALT
jgi:trehalose 6-phosphate phosphatase